MDKCRNIRKFLFEYNHNELDPERCRDVQMHLDNCPRCSACFSEVGTFLSSVTYCKDISFVKNHPAKRIDGTFLSRGVIGFAEDFWADYDNKLFKRLEDAQRRTVFQLYLPELRPVITEALAGFLVVLGLFAMVEKGFLGYDLKTYIYLLKQVW